VLDVVTARRGADKVVRVQQGKITFERRAAAVRCKGNLATLRQSPEYVPDPSNGFSALMLPARIVRARA
jgi:hypothetical protein